MKNVTITINAENPNPWYGETSVAPAIEWATAEVAKADAELDNVAERYDKAVDAWYTDENPSAEVEAEYRAARRVHEKATTIKKEYEKVLKTLNQLEMDLLHLYWAMDENNY
jgi:uncharacterized membrane protein YccC